MVSVVDARYAHDRVKSDVAPTAGAQKPLAFTIAALRQVFRAPGTAVRWTRTENMLADVLTKIMDSAHPVSVLGKSEWSVVYSEDLMKGAAKAENRRRLKLEKREQLEAATKALDTALDRCGQTGTRAKRLLGVRFAIQA